MQFGPLFYRGIEKEKTLALKRNCGDYDSVMQITDKIWLELKWWIENLSVQKRKMYQSRFSYYD